MQEKIVSFICKIKFKRKFQLLEMQSVLKSLMR